VDTLRADRLSCYGYEGHETPHIDRLADRGVKFTRACSVASWTVPSMGAMLTSLYPTQLNLIERLAPPGKRFEPREKRQQRAYTLPLFPRTLPEILAEAGFRTVGFVDQPALNFGNGFLQGFADWFYPVGPDEIKYHDPRQPLVAQEWPSLKYADRSDMALIREFDGWLAVHAEQRLFVWFQLLTPHRPYKPAPKYMPQRDDEGDSEPTATELYEGEVRAVDDMIGEILASIDRYVGLKRSLVVFVSDHGEELGERGMKDHGHTLHREIIHVPLIIASPSLPAGETVDTYVRTIDILPSVLELVDRQLPAPVAMEGSSLVELTRDDARAHRPVFSEAMLYGSTERSLVHGAYKLMYDEQDEQYRLFNALSDPDETIDLGLQEPERRDAMRSTLWELHNGLRNEYLDRFGSQPVSPHSEEELQQALEALRALGYVDD
jgi:arylsulfatase A-like enzyme